MSLAKAQPSLRFILSATSSFYLITRQNLWLPKYGCFFIFSQANSDHSSCSLLSFKQCLHVTCFNEISLIKAMKLKDKEQKQEQLVGRPSGRINNTSSQRPSHHLIQILNERALNTAQPAFLFNPNLPISKPCNTVITTNFS